MAVKQKILIVDDDNNIAELISLYLTKECYDTKIVNDGEEALVAFDTYNPNLILLDLMLPGIDGYQVCREIRAKANVPIIMLSAKGEIFDKVLGLELGADDYILKPFDSKELVVSDDEYSYVFVIDENSVAEKRNVKTGKLIDAKVQILEGLYAGEKVIVEGMLSVSDGIKVNDISNPVLNQEETEPSSDVKNNL